MGRLLVGFYNSFVLIISDDWQVSVKIFVLVIDEFTAYPVSVRLQVVV